MDNPTVKPGDWIQVLSDNYDPGDHYKVVGTIGVVLQLGDLQYVKLYKPGDPYHRRNRDLGYFSYKLLESKIYQLIGDAF